MIAWLARRVFYGWVLVWSVGVTELVSWGVLIYAFSVVLVPMRDELGWSTAQLTGAYSLGVLVSGLAAMPVGRWLDARGPRALMTAGSVATIIVLVGWAQVQAPVAFYALFVLAGLAMAATLYEPAFAIAASWFDAARPRAVLVLTVFGGLASVVFVPLTGLLVEELGWRDALVALAAIVAVVCLPAHALLLRRPADLGIVPERRDGSREASGVSREAALRSRSFRWLSVCLTLATLGRIAVSVHLVAYLVERGYALRSAALAAGAVGLLQVGGRLAATALHGRVPEHVTYSSILVAQGASIALPLLTTGHDSTATAAIVAFVLVYGLGFGIPELMRGLVVAEYYGTRSYASINGTVGLFVTSARAIAPVAAGAVFTLTGSYTIVLVAAGLAALVAAAALLVAHAAHEAESAAPT